MVNMPRAIREQRSVVVTFGPTGSFGYAASAPLAQQQVGWWSNWPTDQPPTSSQMDASVVKRELQERHGTWNDAHIQHCIASSTTDRVYPLWTTPALPHWGERGCVLLGDAAHTLQATSGQGAAQALEDSATFSLLLSRYLEQDAAREAVSACIEAATRGLYELRHERVANIKTRARNLYFGRRQSRSVVWEYVYYCFLLVVTNFPRLGE